GRPLPRRRGRLPLLRRPHGRHHQDARREGEPQGGRERALRAPGRARGGGDRRARPPPRQRHQGDPRDRRQPQRARGDPLLRGAPRGVHGALDGGVPRRAAQERQRQDQPARAGGGGGMNARFDPLALSIDVAQETDRIAAALREQVLKDLRRKGLVLGLSGGIDSSVVAALAVRALGAGRVLGVLMPERDSDPDSLRLGGEVARWLGIESVVEDIAPILEAAGCYRRRDEFMRRLVPEYGAGWRSKIVLRRANGTAGYNVFNLVVRGPRGEEREARMPPEVYLGVVATTSMKQRTRKQIEYF